MADLITKVFCSLKADPEHLDKAVKSYFPSRSGASRFLHGRIIINSSAVNEERHPPHNLYVFRSSAFYRFAIIRN